MQTPTQKILDAFPRRSIKLLYTGQPRLALLGVLLGLILSLGLFVMLARELIPGIVTDTKLKWGDGYTIDTLATVTGSCRQMRFVFVSCKGKIAYFSAGPGSPVATRHIDFMFVGTSPDVSIEVLRSRSNPALISTRASLERWGNIVAVNAGMLAMIAGAFIGMILYGKKVIKAHIALGKTLVLRPLLVRVGQSGSSIGLEYEEQVDGKQHRANAHILAGARPLYMQWNMHYALAVYVEVTRQVIVLDEHLHSLELTPEEKQTLLACAQEG